MYPGDKRVSFAHPHDEGGTIIGLEVEVYVKMNARRLVFIASVCLSVALRDY